MNPQKIYFLTNTLWYRSVNSIHVFFGKTEISVTRQPQQQEMCAIGNQRSTTSVELLVRVHELQRSRDMKL